MGESQIGMNGASVTFNNVTFNWAAHGWPYHGLQHCGNMKYNNCTINGTVFLYGTSEIFNNCTFNVTGDTYNVWTYGAKEVVFNGCTFNSAGKSVLIYSEQSDLVNNVTVTDCDFIASSPVEGKAAIEMDSSLTDGINLTIDGETTATGFGSGNVSGNSLWNNKKGNNDDANNDITVVVDGETVLEPVYVAKIGEEGHRTLQEAIGKAVAGDNTIQLLANIEGDVTILQQEGIYIVIDGKKNDTENYTFNGTINIYGNARHTGEETLTIQNVNFYTKDNARYFIEANEYGQIPETNNFKQYAHNVTVMNCNFSAENTENTVVGMRFRQAYNVSAVNCTSDGIFSIMWTTAVDGLTLNGVEARNCEEGITIGGASKEVEIIGTTINSETYAIRAEGDGSDFTIENSTLVAKVPVVVRNVTENSMISFTFNGTNTITESNPTNYWFVAGETEYKGADEVMPTAPKGQVSVTLNDTGLRYEDVYGNYYELAGEGTANNPYTIANLYELKFFRDQVNAGNNYQGKYVKLTGDIDLAEGQNRGAEESNWTPIGNSTNKFQGTFDGQNHTISNLVINDGNSSNQGFFGFTTNGEIKNVIFENAKVTGRLNVGVVAGTPYTSKYTNIKVTGHVEVNGMSYVGGVGGKNAYANWTDITVDVDGESYVKATSTENGTQYRTYVGGVIGFNGEGGHTFKNISSNINVIGDVCDIGGIFGIAHYGNKFENITHTGTVTNTNSNAEDVVETGLIAGVWHNQAGTSVTFTNTTSTGTISVPNVTGVTFPNDGLIGAAYTTSNETSSTSGSLTINGEQVYPYVAKIGEVGYNTLAKAITAAQNEDVVTLLWVEGDAPIAMNASLYGKNVTITGIATVDWNKGWLFVGRGGAGDATLTFDNAKLTSNEESLANGTYGIHVSAKEGNDVNKNYGKVIFKNSDVQLSYLANRNDVEVDGGKLYVHYGFWVGGRPSTETPDGSEGTATMDIKNGAVVEVNNHNGMGIGHEGNGVMNITSSTFKYTGTSFNLAKEDNSSVNVYGESTIEITTLEGGSSIDLMDGAIVKNSTIGGDVFVAGNVTFRGDNTFAMLYDYGTLTGHYGTTANMEWTVEEGASLTLTKMARYGLGYGDNVTINGSITNALEARENLTEDDRSLFMHGLVAQESSGYNCNSKLTVNNAYVVLGSNNSFGNKPGNYGGNYTFNFNNSVVDGSRITFYEASSITEFTFEDSDVKIGTFMTRDTDSKFTLKNSKVLSTAISNGTDEGNYNAGELELNNSILTYNVAFTNTGTLNLDLNSKLTAPSVAGNGTINIDATDFDGNEICVISANMASFEGVINVEGAHYMKKADGIYVTGAQGTLTKAYTSATGYWGECGGNANESFVLKFYNDDTYMGQTSLNDIDNIIDGDVYVTWSIDLNIDPNAEGYWAMSWDIRPTLAMQPNRVEQWIDGVKVAECAVEPNWADNIFPVVAAVTGEDDVILSYVNNTAGATLKDAFAAGGNVTILRDFNLSETVTVPTDKTVVLDLNGKAIAMTNNIITTTYAIDNLGTLTIEDSSTDKTGSVSARGIYNGYDADGNNVATAKITIEGGTFNAKGENGGAAVYNYGIADIKGGKFTSVGSYSLNNQSGASMTIADGVEATGGIYNSGATLTVNGGKISNSRSGAHTIYSWDSNVTLKDGEIHNENSNNATIFADGTSEVNIVDGTFTIKVVDESSSYLIDTDSKLNISGGEFTGGIRVQANGNMSITEGTYHNNHGNYNVYEGGSLVISGGTFCENAKTFVEDNLAQGYALKELANGYYTVIQVAGTQTTELITGWNWFSTYIKQGNDGLSLLQNALNPYGVEIKSREGFTRYYTGLNDWSPSQTLTSVSTTKMYMIKTSAAHTLELEGDFEDENIEITIAPGWNWIGYPVHEEGISFEDALSNIEPAHGDIIKSQSLYAQYIDMFGTVGWAVENGESLIMNPGEGYKYYSNKSQVFRFTYSTEVNSTRETSIETIDNYWLTDANQYSGNMTMLAMLSVDGEIVKGNYEVAAFANGECRGSARPIYIEALDAYVLLMTIHGEEVEELTFKYYDVNYGTEYELNNRINYSDDAIVGSFEEPYMFNLGILNIDESSVENISIYPNPTTTGKEINLQAMCDKVEVFNALGVKVAEYTNVDSIDAIETAGIYVIRVTIDGNARNCRLIVK
ncbi:MAG: T9SS type A sorting domain-containing protein [Bacteroidales bacterium]|nr:T9SS type A sorting domain-containing protein [Bacteroidales bacterium]